MGYMLFACADKRFIRRWSGCSVRTGAAPEMSCRGSRHIYLFCILCSVLILFGCSTSWFPSDDETVKLVNNYYLFYHEGQAVEVKIVKRSQYSKDCDCIPMEFEVKPADKDTFKKVFYFFKNETGKTDIRIYRLGMQHTSR